MTLVCAAKFLTTDGTLFPEYVYAHQGLELETVHPHLKNKRRILGAVRLLQATIRMACLRKYGRESLKAGVVSNAALHVHDDVSEKVAQGQEQENRDLYEAQSEMLTQKKKKRQEKRKAASAGAT